MQKNANLVDIVKSFPTNMFLQHLASIQKRTSPVKFAHLAEKSDNGSTSNLSTKVTGPPAGPAPRRRRAALAGGLLEDHGAGPLKAFKQDDLVRIPVQNLN